MEPKIPTLKDSKKPQVKVRGLEAGVTLFDRLKQFKKKDLAFILAGLGTLFMAPLAEHFMMAPESGDAALNAGFGGNGRGGGHGLFDNSGGGSVGYDVSNGQAPGSAIGGGSDVITPLNVRDPSALVMGPGATQQPPTNSVAPASPPPTAPVTRSDSDLKDALAASARGVGAAGRAAKALLPVPKIGLTGAGGLRGLGVANGGSSASASLAPISSAGLAGTRADLHSGAAGVRGGKDIKGVARGQSAGGGGLEALKAAAGNAGEAMNRGAASTALDNAAAQAIPTGGANFGGGGQGGAGANDKAGSGNGNKDNHSAGESLEFLKQKAMQEKKIELWAKEQEAGDGRLEMLKIRNTSAEAFASEMVKGASAKMSACLFKGYKNKDCMGTAADSGYVLCSGPSLQKFDGDGFGNCGDDGVTLELLGGTVYSCKSIGTGDKASMIRDPQSIMGTGCDSHLGSGKAAASTEQTDPHRSVGGANGSNPMAGQPVVPSGASLAALGKTCERIEKSVMQEDASNPGITGVNTFLGGLHDEARRLVVVRDALYTGKESGDCNKAVGKPTVAPAVETGGKSILSQLKEVITATRGADDKDSDSVIAQMQAAVDKKDLKKKPEKVPGSEDLGKAEEALTKISGILEAAGKTMPAGAQAHAAGLPDMWKNNADASSKATTFKNDLSLLNGTVAEALKNATTVRDNLATAHRSLDQAVPKIDDVLGSKVDRTTQSERATKAPYKLTKNEPAADDPKNPKPKPGIGDVPTGKAIEAANKALLTDNEATPVGDPNPQYVPKALKLSLDFYDTNFKDVKPDPSNPKLQSNQVLAQIQKNFDAAVEKGAAMESTTDAWLGSIKDQTPQPSQIPDKQ